MSDTTSDTDAIDKKKEETTVTSNYGTNVKNFGLSVLSNSLSFIIYFSLSGLILFGCKLAQSNILPTEGKCYPYTETKPVIKQSVMNLFTTTILDDTGNKVQKSLKMNIPYNDYNSTNKLLDMTREYRNEPRSHFLANYFISIVESLTQFNYSAYTSILNMLNGLPESIIMLFGPIMFGIITAIVLLCNNLYLIYLWFSNMGWFFKTNTNTSTSGKPQWEDVTWTSLVSYCIAIWLVIIFALGFLFTMPVFFFFTLALLWWLILSSLTFKTEMNDKPYSLLVFIRDSFKYNKPLIIFVFSLFVVSAAFTNLGRGVGAFSIVTLILIYFKIIPGINLFDPVNNDAMTAASSTGFEQATKTCNGKGIVKATLGSAFGNAMGAAKKAFSGGSNLKKELLKLNKSRN